MRATDLLMARDAHADRPAATAVPAGTLYPCSDHGIIYQSDGATWATWNPAGGGGGGSLATDTLADAKGDLFVATTADTITRLAVGANGKAVIAASPESKGVKWGHPVRGIDVPASSPDTVDDEFDDTTGNSGPTNGLNARWTKRNMGTAGWSVLDSSKAPECFAFDVPTGQSADQAIYQAVPAGDFQISTRVQRIGTSDRQMWGLFVVSSTGTGISILFDDPAQDANTYMRSVGTWAQSGAGASISPSLNHAFYAGIPIVLNLRKSGTTYYASGFAGDLATAAFVYEVSNTPSAFTPAYVGFGRLHGTGSARIAVDWFRKTA